jgi:hypothetical protein
MNINVNPNDLNIPKEAVANNDTINNVLQLVFALGASVAFIVIIIAGIQFILSRGDPGKTATARSTVIYAAVGLVLASSAYSIVRFVLGNV